MFVFSASKQRASGEDNPYIDELKLAVTWNRDDMAKSELFNGSIHWKVRRGKDRCYTEINIVMCSVLYSSLNLLYLALIKQYEDLEDSMTDALINDKPHFVRLFTENGLNILNYLTYGRLESLYRAVPEGTLLYQLLRSRLVERLGNAAVAAPPSERETSPKEAAENNRRESVNDITLFEVNLLMKEMLHSYKLSSVSE